MKQISKSEEQERCSLTQNIYVADVLTSIYWNTVIWDFSLIYYFAYFKICKSLIVVLFWKILQLGN